MDKQQNRVVDVLASYFYPLVNAADTNAFEAGDTIGRCDDTVFGDIVLQKLPVQQGGRNEDKNETRQDLRHDLHDPKSFPDQEFTSYFVLV